MSAPPDLPNTPSPPNTPDPTEQRYRLGCPIWACPSWRGSLYSPRASPKDFLREYSQVFGCVEGNSTFYALPPLETVDKWREATPDGFHFCFKFPKAISHERRLVGVDRETEAFFARMERLPNRLGPLLLQLPPTFGPRDLPYLDRYLEALPRTYRYAVEVRHPSLFAKPHEAHLDAMLQAHGVARGLMDTRAIHAAAPKDPTTIVSQGRKPKVPLRTNVTARTPFVRIVGQNDVRATTGYLDEWAITAAEWLKRSWSPYIFLHAPDDYYAPRQARAFHFLLRRRRPELPEMTAWPGELQPADSQLGLL